MELTAEHLRAARAAGACARALLGLRVGQRVGEVPQEWLIWAERHMPEIAETILARTGVPVWALADSGYSYGYGSGYGSGDGSGYGDGSSYGSGYGSGDGSGYGDGSGHGYGNLPS